ncbi:hypothetical protein MTO96_033721 [Rhipicephalus appendiculatus]
MMPDANFGFLFVLFMEKFGVSREIASWPHTISKVMTTFVGLSLGTLLIGTSVYVVSYFDEYRNVATGIKFLGVSVSGVIGPILLPAVMDTYGLAGLLLIVGGIILNVIPLTLLLRNPQPTSVFLRCFKMSKSSISNKPEASTLTTTRKEYGRETQHWDGVTNTFHRDDTSIWAAKCCSAQETPTYGSVLQASEIPGARMHGFQTESGMFTQMFEVLRMPIFYVILVPIALADFTLPLFASTIVDYGRDKGILLEKAALLLTYLCVGGFCGRLGISVLSDKIANGRCIITAISLIILSACFVLLPHVDIFPAVVAVTFVTGLQLGYLGTIKTVLSADFLGVQKVPLCWGLIGIASLPLTVFEPSIVAASGPTDNDQEMTKETMDTDDQNSKTELGYTRGFAEDSPSSDEAIQVESASGVESEHCEASKGDDDEAKNGHWQFALSLRELKRLRRQMRTNGRFQAGR